MNSYEIPYPRLLTPSLGLARVIQPINVSITLSMTPLSYASMELPSGESLPARGLVELFTPLGSAGIFRVRSPQNTYGERSTTAELEHAIVEVGDYLVTTDIDDMMPAASAMQTVFGHYRGSLWQLGSVSAMGTGEIAVQAKHTRVLETMIALVEQCEDCMFAFDFTTTPWTVSIIKQPKGASMEIDEQEDFFLTIEARTTKGGNLSYQWYSASTNSAAAMTIIPGATYNSYTPERVAGTKFYRVSVTLTDRGVTSEPIFSSICAVTFTDRTVHVHSYSDFWEANDISHWHQCTCGDHADEAFHTYPWTVLKAATKTEDGEQKGVCSVCGHETVQPIPAGSVTEEPEVKTPAKKSGVNVLMLAFGLLAAGVVIGAALLIRCVLKDDGEDSPGEGTPGEEKPKDKKTGKAKKKE